MKLSISSGNSKLGRIMNFSLLPYYDCGSARNVCGKHCYAVCITNRWRTVRNCWTKNSQAIHKDLNNLNNINLSLKSEPCNLFRIHVGGDFISQEYLNIWSEIASNHQNTIFTAYTKQYDLNYKNMPPNMNIIFSMWNGIDVPRNNSFLKAWIETDSRIPELTKQCSLFQKQKHKHTMKKTCNGCRICYDISNNSRDIILKYRNVTNKLIKKSE
jgi:hypothetical protein